MTPTDSPETTPAEKSGGDSPPTPVVTVDAAATTADTTTAEAKPPAPAPEALPAAIVAEAAPGEPPVPAVIPPPGPGEPPAAPSAEAKEKPAEAMTAEDKAALTRPPERVAPASILAIDVGGTKVKLLATGQTEPRKAPTGKEFTPTKLVETVKELAKDWEYEAISIGYPGLVGTNGPRSEPGNLGPGWVGFDFAAAFGKPVKMINDAAMQALGSYEGGRMLFLGLGTGLGSTLIAGHVVIPLELGRLLYDGERRLSEVLGRRGYEKLSKGDWREAVNKTVTNLMAAFVADYVVIGGGLAKHVKDLPPGARHGHNLTAFRGGFRVWSVEDVWELAASGGESPPPTTTQEGTRML